MDALGNVYTPGKESPWKMYKITPAGVSTEFLTHSNIAIYTMVIDSTGNAYFEGRANGWIYIKSLERCIFWSFKL